MTKETNLKYTSALRVSLVLLFLTWGSLRQARADNIAPPYAGQYALLELGSVPGVPGPYGGLTLLAASPNELLIGGNANNGSGAIYEIGVTRDAHNNITGFVGTASLYSTAPDIDGGLAYGPGGVLFYTAYPINTIGEIKLGDSTPDKLVSLTGLVASSVGSLNFVPVGQPGAGDFKIASYNGGGFYNATLSPDGSGTYNITSATLQSTPGGGPEGFIYVPTGSADFSIPSLLIAQYSLGKVEACQSDADGNPVVATCQDFVQGLSGAEGGFVDPLSGDFLFSTFGGGNKVVEVQGFAPLSTPEPGSASLFGIALGGLVILFRRLA